MPYRQPLVPHILHVADPLELPVRKPGDPGPVRVTSAAVGSTHAGGCVLEASLSDGGRARVEVDAVDEGVIRVRLRPDAKTEGRSDRAIRLVHPTGYAAGRAETGEGRAVVDAGGVLAEIDLDPVRIRFLDHKGDLLTEQNIDESDISQRLRVLPFGQSTDAGGTVVAYHETFSARADEHFFGLGEKFTALDKRGQHIVSWNYDAFSAESERSYKNVPFYLSTRGYGVLVNSGLPVEFDICHSTHSCVQVTVPDDMLEYYLIAGPQLDRVVDRYHRLTGRPVTPPKWALGAWISTGYQRIDQQQTIEQARRIRDHGIPCDVLHLDAYWQKRGDWCDLRWDGTVFPDPEAMLAEIRALGYQVCVWMNPYVSQESPVFAEGAAAGHFLKRADGSVYVADVWHGARPAGGIVDFTSPEATRWFQGLLTPLLRQGVSVFKTDFGEGVPVDAVAANGMRGDALHNVYSLLFNDAVAEVTEQHAGHRVVWARSSYTGGQRHCGQWAGDTNCTFASMASTLRGGLSYAYSGFPFWSHDVGGFTGVPAPDLFARSAQFGAFSPMMRFHGTSSRFPWDYDDATAEAVTEAVRLRYRLMPYLYSAAVEAGLSGMPIMRPLGLITQDEPGAWSADLEYLFGPDLLVAPVCDPSGERHVYLPSGTWVDYWTGETCSGGRHVRVRQPVDRIPLFVRHGALIALAEPVPAVGDGPFSGVTLAYWGDGDATTEVHDVNGTTVIELTRGGERIDVVTTGPLPVDGVLLSPLAGRSPVTACTINGVPGRFTPPDRWITAGPDEDGPR